MPMGIPLRADLARYLAITVCCSALSSPALAAGAVAVADEPDGPGWVVEISVRETDASAAKAAALKGCRKRTVENKFDPDFCEIVSEFTNRCAAASMNPDGPGEAWAVADTLEASSRKDAIRLLPARGLQPLRVDEASACHRQPGWGVRQRHRAACGARKAWRRRSVRRGADTGAPLSWLQRRR